MLAMTKFKNIIFEKNVAIHCPEEWMANELLKYADSKGCKWNSGNSYLDYNRWKEYKERSCYRVGFGRSSDKIFHKSQNYKVIHYNDVVIKEIIAQIVDGNGKV